jgi:hypothetical protein
MRKHYCGARCGTHLESQSLELEASLAGFIARPCLRTKKIQKTKNKRKEGKNEGRKEGRKKTRVGGVRKKSSL